MAAPSEFCQIALPGWFIVARRQLWNAPLQQQVLALVGSQTAARHPQTVAFSPELNGAAQKLFLKVFHRSSALAALKEPVRGSPAFNNWRQVQALTAAGFNAPITVAVGKEMTWRVARREFIVSEAVAGVPLSVHLDRTHAAGSASGAHKRAQIEQLARLLRRFHDAGFVHGDLVATNLLVAQRSRTAVEFFFMDNDRTRRYPSWFNQTFWKRNLIQLNRMPLPGISLQDRVRFLQSYLNLKRLGAAERRFARWLEARTRQRRRECDGVDASGSFRRLMRWTPEMAGAKHG
jgi:hypothetical protein